MKTAACKYCGQTFMIDIDDKDWPDANGDMELVATRRCMCDGAQHFKALERKKEKANDNISIAFEQDEPAIAEVLKYAVDGIVNEKMYKITINGDKVKAVLQRTTKGTIKVSRTDQEVQEYNE